MNNLNIRIAIITNGNFFSRIILEPLLLKYTRNVVGIVFVDGDYRGRTGFRALWEVGRKTAFPYLAYKVAQHVLFKLVQAMNPKAWIELEAVTKDLGLPGLHVRKVNSPEVHNWLQGLRPDLLISVSCPQRISPKLLRLARIAALNVHSSLLPRYAGLAPYYWVLAEGETFTGVTVHYMTEEFDAGNILVQKTLPIPPRATAFGLFEKLAALGSEALLEAVDLALEGDPGKPQDLRQRTYFSHPTWPSYWKMKRNGYEIVRISELVMALRKALTSRPKIKGGGAHA
jgi:folate-dependent phosphoribosylglycinamide formyltransferase PurN